MLRGLSSNQQKKVCTLRYLYGIDHVATLTEGARHLFLDQPVAFASARFQPSSVTHDEPPPCVGDDSHLLQAMRNRGDGRPAHAEHDREILVGQRERVSTRAVVGK